ncbi:MAG: glutamate formimidoyltransferase, partial [Bacteroidota bacterium]
SFQSKAGATVIGARPFLIAWNVNLDTRSVHLAKAIAAELRESGRLQKTKTGKPHRVPGRFKCVKAIGWFIEEYDCAQVSMNLTNYRVSPPHEVMEACRQIAAERGVAVSGSELIGMVPLEVLLMAGRYALRQTAAGTARPSEAMLVDAAIDLLGLSDLRPFVPEERIIEYRMQQ